MNIFRKLKNCELRFEGAAMASPVDEGRLGEGPWFC
jgi:hypothetical protein